MVSSRFSKTLQTFCRNIGSTTGRTGKP